jgi:hypothetical protein
MSYARGVMIGGKDRQAPVDESIMPAPVDGAYLTTSWQQTGLTWADIIEMENAKWRDASPSSTALSAKS